MTPNELRAIATQRIFELELVRNHPELTEQALQYLSEQAKKTLEWEEAVVLGIEFDVTGCIGACRASAIGEMIFGSTDDADNTAIDHEAAIAGLTPQQRLSYAHEHKLL